MRRMAWAAVVLGTINVMSVSKSDAREWTRYGTEQGLPDEAIRSLCVDGAGRLWVGALDGGLAVLDGDRFRVIGADQIRTPHVRDLAWSTRGELWAATDEGAARLKGDQIDWMQRGTSGLASADLVRVIPDVGGRTWLLPFEMTSGETPAISAWDGNKMTSLSMPEGAARGGFLEMARAPLPGAAAPSTLLITESALYKVTDDDRIETVNVEGTPLWRVTPKARDEEAESRRRPPFSLATAHQAKDGTVWFVHPHAIVTLDATGFRERLAHDGYPLGDFAAEATDGTMWFLSHDERLIGLGRGDSTQIIPVKIEGQEMFREVVPGSGGAVWIGVDGQPAILFRVASGAKTPERWPVEAGSERAISVNALLEDPAGNVWVASDNGLFRLTED